MKNERITRLAPSPTGALHLGNARTFLVNWLMARQGGWKIVLRIEDLDGPRVKKHADQQVIEDLRWLGADWDEGPVYQSSRVAIYRDAIEDLIQGGSVYPCICTRNEVESAASAPHAEDGSAAYPGTCRGRFTSVAEAAATSNRAPALRFRIDERVVRFVDRFRGPVEINVGTLGDFVIAKTDGTPAYQLAVVVDDAAMNVTDVVRGDDLLDSTPRQMLLYQALAMNAQIPTYWHIPLVIGTDGRRLAKRHGDTRLSYYRSIGVTAERVLQLLARWCGIAASQPISRASDLVGRLDLTKMSRQPIVFTEREDAWLRAK